MRMRVDPTRVAVTILAWKTLSIILDLLNRVFNRSSIRTEQCMVQIRIIFSLGKTRRLYRHRRDRSTGVSLTLLSSRAHQ